MIILHHLNNSRSQRILWMLEELGLEYELKHYQRDLKTMLAPPELEQVHPLGKSPVLTDGDITVAESGAIIEYLAATYGEGTLLPPLGSPEHRQYIYWLHYAEGSLMPQLLLQLVFSKVKSAPMPFFIRPVAKAIANNVMSAFVQPNIDRNMRFIEQHLADNSFFAGERMSGADIQMSFPLEAAVARASLGNKFPNIVAYVARFQALPAYRRALEVGGPYDYA